MFRNCLKENTQEEVLAIYYPLDSLNFPKHPVIIIIKVSKEMLKGKRFIYFQCMLSAEVWL